MAIGWKLGAACAAVALVVGACSGDDNAQTDGGTDATTDVSTNACGNAGTLCSGTCVNTQNDNANCGTCGDACPSGEVCSQGKCATSCGGGTKLCGSICADTKDDPQNCGACGTQCGSGEVCSNGACGNTCSSGQTFCGGDSGAPYCANTKTDNANCGGCGVTCGTGQVCDNGACSNSCGGGDAGTETLCTPDGGLPYCANTTSDNQNCGGCGTTCGAQAICSGGQCQSTCVQGQTLCTPDAGAPYCAVTATDNQNCGGCGIACGTGKVCQNGSCKNACASQDGGVETLCAPDGGSPYCADLANDNDNCGTCGAACNNQACVSGTCSGAVLHDDGLGEHWADLVTYGTHNITQAAAACQAYIAAHPSDTCDTTDFCSCTGSQECVYNVAGGGGETRRTWFFAGALDGTVTDDSCAASNIPWN